MLNDSLHPILLHKTSVHKRDFLEEPPIEYVTVIELPAAVVVYMQLNPMACHTQQTKAEPNALWSFIVA